jgi:diketogulonate reductase-like aldo/keto reductase
MTGVTKMIIAENYVLANGLTIPKLGYGTWMIQDDKAAEAVKNALNVGYRHIDTAQAYGNERGVGEGIRASQVDRKDIFVTTKLAAEIKSYDEAVAAINESLKKLDIGYIDLMIIHSPQPWDKFREGHYFEGNLAAWRALEEAYNDGKLKAIGVSNFEQEDIDNLLTNGSIKPMVNQVLAHISNTPFELIDYCQKQNILVEAYSPVAHGEILKHPEVMKMAEKYEVSVPQLCIRYCLQLELLPLPKSENIKHIKSNTLVDFEISAADMEALKKLKPLEDYGDSSKFPVFSGK